MRIIAGLLPKEIEANIAQSFVARLPMPVASTDEWIRIHGPGEGPGLQNRNRQT